MKDKLVSIITPCYNGESYLHRFFNTILNQSYSNIELIFVNDGSTDQTEEIALSYRQKLEARGIKYTYIYQDNAGQAAALNQGLKIFKGEYLVWTDSDDILHNDNIKIKVEFMEENPQYQFAMCRGNQVLEENINRKVDDYRRIRPKGKDSLFTDLLLENNVVFTPGIYIVRRKAFLDVNPKREIYVTRIGQNWQMLLPLAYNFECGYIEKELFSYVVREESHSRDVKTQTEMIQKYKMHKEVLVHLLQEMKVEEVEKYLKMLDIKYLRQELNIAISYKDTKMMKEKYLEIKNQGVLTIKDYIIYLTGKSQIIKDVFMGLKKIKKRLVKIIYE